MFGIYIHSPFCKKVCDYCDFHVMPYIPKLFQEYTDLVCREIQLFELAHPGILASARTLYLGGGTPSELPAGALRQIFQCLSDVGVEISSLKEVSMEFNPESTTPEKVENALDLGVRRLSLGLQTFDPELLKVVGRSHSVECGLSALQYLTGLSQVQVSGDLMFNLPSQTLQGFLDDVDRLSDFPLNHISFYGLTVSPRTALGHRIAKGCLFVDEDLYEPMYLGGVEILDGKGFKRYEVSNFARPGFESVHNRNYWDRGEYAGFGPGAHSFMGMSRFYAPEMYPRWREYVKNGARQSDLNVDSLNGEDVLAELIWLSLRQAKGLELKSLQEVGFSLDERLVSKWVQKKYLVKEKGSVRLEGRGWLFMDDIATDLMNSSSS